MEGREHETKYVLPRKVYRTKERKRKSLNIVCTATGSNFGHNKH